MLVSMVLGRQYIPLVFNIHTLVYATFIAPRRLNPSFVIITFIAPIVEVSSNPILTLRFQIARIHCIQIRTRELYLKLVEKVIII